LDIFPFFPLSFLPPLRVPVDDGMLDIGNDGARETETKQPT